MIDILLTWLRDNQALSGWFQGITALLAGIFAIIAGYIAFFGARKQAEASINSVLNQLKFESDRDESLRTEQRRSIAATIWAELLDNRQRLLAIKKQTALNSRRDLGAIPDLDISMFKFSPTDIGKLPTDEIIYVIGCYRALEFANGKFKLFAKIFQSQADQIIRQKILEKIHNESADLIEQIDLGLKGIRASAGISEEVANSLLDHLSNR